MGDALKAWAEASKARSEASKAKTETLLARVERYKGGTSTEATSSLSTHEFSITKCMTALEILDCLTVTNIRRLLKSSHLWSGEKFL